MERQVTLTTGQIDALTQTGAYLTEDENGDKVNLVVEDE